MLSYTFNEHLMQNLCESFIHLGGTLKFINPADNHWQFQFECRWWSLSDDLACGPHGTIEGHDWTNSVQFSLKPAQLRVDYRDGCIGRREGYPSHHSPHSSTQRRSEGGARRDRWQCSQRRPSGIYTGVQLKASKGCVLKFFSVRKWSIGCLSITDNH